MDVFKNIAVHEFISVVKNEPAIWNGASKEFNNKDAKAAAWYNVITHFLKDYDEKRSNERQFILQGFQRKWKSLRDCYSRELLKRRKESVRGLKKYRRSYIYFDQLDFLQKFCRNKFDNSPESPEQSDEDDDVKEIVATIKENNPNNRKRCLEEIDPFEDLGETSSTEFMDTAKEELEKNSMFMLKEIDADTLFMLSLVPELKKVPEDLKLDVKCELMKVFKNVKRTSSFSCNEPDIIKTSPVHQ